MKLTKEKIYRLKNDTFQTGSVTFDLLDTIDALESDLARERASAAALLEKARRDEAEQMYFILVLTDASEEYRLAEARKRMAENGSPQCATGRAVPAAAADPRNRAPPA